MSARTKGVLTLAVTVLLVVLGALVGGGELGPDGPGRAGEVPRNGEVSRTGSSGLPTVRLEHLPPEARDTVALIEDGGPFPYDRDGTVFHNYEGLLPERADGYYREYTVPTPGEDDRGARRIVEGAPGEWYWTDDHYASFAEVVP